MNDELGQLTSCAAQDGIWQTSGCIAASFLAGPQSQTEKLQLDVDSNSAPTRISIHSLFRRGWRFAFPGVPKNKKPPLLIGDVNVAASIDKNVFRLSYEFIARNRADALGRSWRNEPARLRGDARVFDVEDPEAGVEVCRVD
jgi:hypothetical protein